MAGVASGSHSLQITGLGGVNFTMANSFTGVVPTRVESSVRTLASANTAEALGLGNVTVVKGILIRAIDYSLDVDTSFVDSFVAEITIPAGESAYFRPTGVVQVKNTTAGQSPQYEYIVYGTAS